MPDNETTTETEAQAPMDGDAARDAAANLNAAAERLIRAHNTQIFAVFIIGLACIGVRLSTQPVTIHEGAAWWTLAVLRVALPILAMVITGIVTNRLLKRFAVAHPDGYAVPDLFPVFSTCKRVSMWLLTAAGVFASACLLVTGGRVVDVILAVIPLGLLIVTRPSLELINHFGATLAALYEVRPFAAESGEEAAAE